ncbi:hypothetical protein B0H14DRAFT_1324823 [Mycena olivaceomarginata]|nr:hypothetical protein B0H14DRAFT_1324823 [Mycena olivaceomarginata]
MSYNIQTHTLVQPRTGLYSLANQYIPHDSNPEGVTLVFAHSTSNHKEQWDVVISRIFELFPGRVNEMWAIDWQNHGDSAVMNGHVLKTKMAYYADVFALFRRVSLCNWQADRCCGTFDCDVCLYGNRDWTAYVLRLGSQAAVISD